MYGTAVDVVDAEDVIDVEPSSMQGTPLMQKSSSKTCIQEDQDTSSTKCSVVLPAHGVAVLIVGTKEFEQLVIFSGDDSDLRFTFGAITQRAHHNSYPSFSSRVVIICAMLLPEANVSRKLLMFWSLHQAALLA